MSREDPGAAAAGAIGRGYEILQHLSVRLA